tara:strand:+ start:5224 stop:5376 length:153 start_codon:yes stop_codon:yes gene_type:complete
MGKYCSFKSIPFVLFSFFYPVSEKVVRFIKWVKTRKCFQKEYKEYEPSLN